MTGRVMGALGRMLDFRTQIEGMEHLVDNPTLFVVNHFTRMETFILPYLLYKQTGRETHSLAHAGLFKGLMGEYLKHMGTVSVREPLRNRRIIGELLAGVHNWVIYPEGLMVKTKEVLHGGDYSILAPNRSGPPHTGAAVLALKAELIRQRYRELKRAGDESAMLDLKNRYGLDLATEPSEKSTVIVPVNITFYPIRPHANAISRLATRMKHDLSERVIEELRTEGSLLLDSAEMSICLCKPIDIQDYLDRFTVSFQKWIPTLTDSTRENFVVWTQKGPLTRAFMDQIYTSSSLHIDHLVCLGLANLQAGRISKDDFHRAICLSALALRERRGRRIHRTIRDPLVRIVADEAYEPLEDIISLAEREGIVTRDGGDYVINRARLEDPHNFHDIRLHNVVRVIANEATPIPEAVTTVARYVNRPPARLRKEIARKLRHQDIGEFDRDYAVYYEEGRSKAPAVGRPFILRSPDRRIGVVLCHGYLAAPAELRPLGDFLHQNGMMVYGVRLRGFGTAPKQLLSVTWQDWLLSFQRAYAIMKNECDAVVLVGFSAGALPVLISASHEKAAVKGIVCINTPLVLADKRVPFAPAALAVNEVMRRLHGPELVNEAVENHSESPEINYDLHYLKGVRELVRMTEEARKCLPRVTAPSLILQGDKDPVALPEGAALLERELGSTSKRTIMIRADNHNIVRRGPRDQVFAHILDFIRGL